MAIHTMGTSSTTALNAIQWFPAVVAGSAGTGQLSLVDFAAIGQSMMGPGMIGAVPWEQIPGAQAVLMTASLHSNTTLDTMVSTGGGPLSSIQVGSIVVGNGLFPGTYVAARTPATGTPTSLTLSQNAGATASGLRFIVPPPQSRGMFFDAAAQRLILPQGRGAVKLFPGDYIAIDSTGWPIIVPQNDIAYPASVWVFT